MGWIWPADLSLPSPIQEDGRDDVSVISMAPIPSVVSEYQQGAREIFERIRDE